MLNDEIPDRRPRKRKKFPKDDNKYSEAKNPVATALRGAQRPQTLDWYLLSIIF